MKKQKVTKEKKTGEPNADATPIDAVDSLEVISTEENTVSEESSNGIPDEPAVLTSEEKSSKPDEKTTLKEMVSEISEEHPVSITEDEKDATPQGNSFFSEGNVNIDTDEATDEPVHTDSDTLLNPIDDVSIAGEGESETTETSQQEIPGEEKPAGEKDNATFIRENIEKLIRLKDEHNFTDFWFYVKVMNKSIYELRGIPREDRQKFKEHLGELCDETKKIQDDLKAKVAKTSHLKLARVQQIADEALAFGTSAEDLEKSFFKIEDANKFLREGKVQGEDGEESADMSREHREQAKEIIKSAKEKIFDRKRAIREGNFKKVTDRLNAISDSLLSQGNAKKVFDGIKNLRNEMHHMNLDRSQLREIDQVIETLWKKAREKANTGREQDSKKQISGLEDLLRRKEVFVKTLAQEIKDLNAKWSTVQNDFFKNRVNEWIEEKKEKIETTKKEIESTREKIKFMQEQIART